QPPHIHPNRQRTEMIKLQTADLANLPSRDQRRIPVPLLWENIRDASIAELRLGDDIRYAVLGHEHCVFALHIFSAIAVQYMERQHVFLEAADGEQSLS